MNRIKVRRKNRDFKVVKGGGGDGCGHERLALAVWWVEIDIAALSESLTALLYSPEVANDRGARLLLSKNGD